MSPPSQQKWPPIEYDTLYQFGHNKDLRVRCAQYHDGYWYAGAQWTAVQADLKGWDFWRFGRWRGPGPLRAVPGELSIDNAVLDETSPADPVAKVGSGIGLIAKCKVLYANELNSFQFRARVYNAGTGAELRADGVRSSEEIHSIALPDLPNGSHMLWVRLSNVARTPLSDEMYHSLTEEAVRPEYRYEEGELVYFWDWRRNLGRMPSDVTHPLYAERRLLELANATLDRPEWAAYIVGTADETGEEGETGEWSALRLQVGTGDWEAGSNVPVSPGPALYQRDVDEPSDVDMSPVWFDPLARSVSAMAVARDGRLLVAGNRASRSGPQLALWQFDGTWKLLGLNPNLSNGICECALSSHDCGSVLEVRDSTIYVLSKCSLHRYIPEELDVRLALADFPAATGGHPGGQCLQERNGTLYWLTEFFGGQSGTENTAQFYNTLESLGLGGNRASGVGTVAHGPNALTIYRGGLTGIVQDKPFNDEDAEQRLSVLEGSRWSDAIPHWKADWFQLQGLESAQGMLVCHGVERHSELPIAAVLDPGAEGDGALQFARLPFRVERISRILRNGREELLIVGKRVEQEAAILDDLPYSIIHLPFHMGTPFPHFCMEWNGVDRFRILISELPVGYIPQDAAPHLQYVPQRGGPGLWMPVEAPFPARYLERVISATHLEYMLHGTEPYPFSAYNKICHTAGKTPFVPEGPSLPPSGLKYTVVRMPLSQECWALQVDDVQEYEEEPENSRPLSRAMQALPSVWLHLGVPANPTHMNSYTVPVPRINTRFNLPRTVTPEVEGEIYALFLWPDTLDGETYEVTSYSLQPRE